MPPDIEVPGDVLVEYAPRPRILAPRLIGLGLFVAAFVAAAIWLHPGMLIGAALFLLVALPSLADLGPRGSLVVLTRNDITIRSWRRGPETFSRDMIEGFHALPLRYGNVVLYARLTRAGQLHGFENRGHGQRGPLVEIPYLNLEPLDSLLPALHAWKRGELAAGQAAAAGP